MSTLYFSGIEKAATADVIGKANASGMMSRLQYSDNLCSVCNSYNMDKVMDCGSFSSPMSRQDIEKYAALIIKLGDSFAWYASADKLGDQQQSSENYTYLLSLLPSHLHDRILWIWQYGADSKALHEALESRTRIGVGGLVPLIRSDRPRASHVITSIARLFDQAGVFPHFFGLSVYFILQQLNSILPDYSVDSTTWITGAKYGILIDRVGRQRSATELGYNFSRESILDQNIRTMRAWLEVSSDSKKQEKYIQEVMF